MSDTMHLAILHKGKWRTVCGVKKGREWVGSKDVQRVDCVKCLRRAFELSNKPKEIAL